MIIPKKKYRVGYLFYKYVMDTPLIDDDRVNTGAKLAVYLQDMGVIEVTGPIIEKDKTSTNWYVYQAGMEHPEGVIVKMIIQYLKEVA